MSSADDQYEQHNDPVSSDVPAGDAQDNDYKSRTGQYQIPVQSDDKPVEDPIDPATADSDETLGTFFILRSDIKSTPMEISLYLPMIVAKDDADAIDQSNIIGGRTRGAKPSGGYAEPGDEEGLPGPEDGTSRLRTGAN